MQILGVLTKQESVRTIRYIIQKSNYTNFNGNVLHKTASVYCNMVNRLHGLCAGFVVLLRLESKLRGMDFIPRLLSRESK